MISWGTRFEPARGYWLAVGPVSLVCTPAWWRLSVGVLRVERRRWLAGVAVGPFALTVGSHFRTKRSPWSSWTISWTPSPERSVSLYGIHISSGLLTEGRGVAANLEARGRLHSAGVVTELVAKLSALRAAAMIHADEDNWFLQTSAPRTYRIEHRIEPLGSGGSGYWSRETSTPTDAARPLPPPRAIDATEAAVLAMRAQAGTVEQHG